MLKQLLPIKGFLQPYVKRHRKSDMQAMWIPFKPSRPVRSLIFGGGGGCMLWVTLMQMDLPQ
jgi:hypothetical protein